MQNALKPVVTITGITGFIGSRICLDFLKTGEYALRGMVRNKHDVSKMEPLRKAFGQHFEQLEIVEADLLDSESVLKAVTGSTYVVHAARPINP